MENNSRQQQQQQSIRCSIDILNDDILKRIFDYLHLDDKIRLRRVCFKWKLILDEQISKLRALRIGQFNSTGSNIISGLHIDCVEHNNNSNNNYRQATKSTNLIGKRFNNNFEKFPDEATIFNDKVLTLPADCETLCYSINRYDYLHRSLKHCYKTITILSLGKLNISYRFLMVITHNLPNLEHLELIACSSRVDERDNQQINDLKQTPSLESFNNEHEESNFNHQQQELYSNLIFNQNSDEQINIRDRLRRTILVKNCQLIKDSKVNNYWPKLKHLLIKDCNLLNEFSLCLIMALTSKTLDHLVIESNQYLTGEFLNYCGPNLKLLRLKYCPLLQLKFLEDLIKIKQLLSSIDQENHQQLLMQQQRNKYSTNQNQQQEPLPQPISPNMFKNFANFNQDIYCAL